MTKEISALKELYKKTSKHSNYQILPESLKKIIDPEMLSTRSRFERERLEYITSLVKIENKNILDIGGNTGYFTFELAAGKAAHIDYYEGNKIHAEFTTLASQLLNLQEIIRVHNSYFNFNEVLPHLPYDVTLLLNILHHVGDDYGSKDLSVELAKKEIINHINYFAGKTRILVLQLGFCWKGNRNTALFNNGTKKELIDFITKGCEKNWNIEAIGIPETINGGIVFSALNEHNIKRNDTMGEFLNRPLFIMKSL